jgi:hypothetical protein
MSAYGKEAGGQFPIFPEFNGYFFSTYNVLATTLKTGFISE